MSLLVWMQSDDAVKGINRPKQVASFLLKGYEGLQSDVTAYASGKDFDEARNEILRQIENGN